MNWIQTNQLFWERMKASWMRASQFMRQIVSGGGTPLFVGMVIIFLYLGYTEMLKTLPDHFPFIPLISLLVAIFLSFSRIRTWIQPADMTFLLPLEAKMAPYFRASLIYSSAMGLIRLFLLALMLSPLYFVKIGSTLDYLIQFAFFALLQVWNTWVYWYLLRLSFHRRTLPIRILHGIRFFFNLGWAFAIFSKNGWVCLLLTLMIFVASWGLIRQVPEIPYPWLALQKREQKIRARYLAIARWFGNMPGIPNPIQPRIWIIRLLDLLFPRASTYSYLFWRTLLRRSDFLQIYIGTCVWAAFIIFSLPYSWIIFGTCLAGVWIVGSQLPTLLRPNLYPIWVQLYPVAPHEFGKALSSLGWVLLILLTLILTGFLLLGGFLPLIWTLGIAFSCLILSGVLCHFVLPKKVQR